MYPRTFSEFYDRFPAFVRRVITKERWRKPWVEDLDDLENELLAELLRKRVVEGFDPTVYGDNLNVRLFLGYIKTCLRSIYLSLLSRDNAVRRQHTAVSLSEPLQGTGNGSTLIDLMDDDGRAVRALRADSELSSVQAYIDRMYPSLSPLLSAMWEMGTTNQDELATRLGLSRSTLSGRQQRLYKICRKLSRK